MHYWISVYDSEKPESGEEILTLSYVGDFPAPEDLFADPMDRAYALCTYFYPGDLGENEIAGDPVKRIPTTFAPITFRKEGFYVQEPVGPRGSMTWRRIHTIAEGDDRGLICWRRLDYPEPH